MTAFRTILADPPWTYDSAQGVMYRKRLSRRYKTMSVDALCGLPVAEVAAPDAILLLWCTWPKMPVGLCVMAAWGFEFVSGFPWIKMQADGAPKLGLGYHTRSVSEMVLIGKRGAARAPDVEKRQAGVIFAPVGEHSAKPDAQYTFAEAYPGPRLEMFARPAGGGLLPPREGWTFIGDAVTGRDIADDLRRLAEVGK